MSTSDAVTTQSPTLSSEDRSARIAVTVFPLLILAAFVGLSPAILVVGAGLFGLAYHRIRKERPL